MIDEIFFNLIAQRNVSNVYFLILVDMATTNAIITELSISQKLDGSNYDI